MAAQMALLEMGDDSTGVVVNEIRTGLASGRRHAGILCLTVAGSASVAWLGWRAAHLGLHPIELLVFAAELVSVVSGLTIGLGLAGASQPREVLINDPRESFRFAFAVADLVGRTRMSDLRVDLVASYRTLLMDARRLPDLSMAAVLTDGPRRLLVVGCLTLAMVLGVAPIPVPPLWAICCGIASMVLMSGAHVLLGGGRIRFGDRIRWSSAALGEVCSGVDLDGVAPRRWVGTVAAVVVLNLAIALRGMSDRWTHGLAPMEADDRHITLLIAIFVVFGGLYTLRTTTAPQLANSHLVSRRTEERTAREAALGGAVAIGMIGLLAGILPGNVDAADHDPPGVEQISDRDPAPVDGVDGLDVVDVVDVVGGSFDG